MILHLSLWRIAVLLIALAPLAFYLIAIVAALRFVRRESRRVLPDFTPPVSLLKPVRGVDFASPLNFASYCRQNYPDYEILFCVNDLSDPAVALLRKLMQAFPEHRIKIFSNAPAIGANPKATQ